MDQQNPTPERPVWAKAFLASLALTGNVSRSAGAANVDRTVTYDLRNADPTFAAEWAQALQTAADWLEEEAVRRARHGVDKPLFHQGKPVNQWVDEEGRPCAPRAKGSRLVPVVLKEYSDSLLMFLLKGCRPEKYRERYEHSGPDGTPLPPVVLYLPDNGRDPHPPAAETGAVPPDAG